MNARRFTLPILALAVGCAQPASSSAGERIRLTYAPARIAAPGTDTAAALSARSDFLPERPLSHPFRTIAGLNRRGEDVFRQPGAVPYLLVGAAALASDQKTVKWFRVPEKGEEKSEFAKTFSTIGSGEVIVPAIVLLYAAGGAHERDTAKLWAAALTNATLWTHVLKLLTGKERPDQADGKPVYHGPGRVEFDSFPSGHTSATVASAVVLGHQTPRLKALFYSVAAAVGVARIEGRNHWPSDVYWGAGVGYYSGWQALRNQELIVRWRF